MKRYAEGTSTPIETTQAEIHRLLRRYGATEYSTGYSGAASAIAFVFKGRRVSFNVPHPTVRDVPRHARNGAAWLEGETRRRWRVLLLGIKSKLEFVQQGIASFDEEFLSHIVTPNGQTVWQTITAHPETAARLLGPVDTQDGGNR